MGLIHIFVLLGELLKCTSLFYVAGFIYCRSFGRRCKLTRSCLCPPSVSVSAQPALLTPPKRSMLSPSPLTPLKRKQSMISLRTRGNLGMTNLSWQRRSLSQVGWLHINSCRARRNEMKPCQKKKTFACVISPFRGGVSVWIVSLPRAWCARGGEVLGGAAGRPPGAAGERDAGGQEDGVPPTGKSRWWNTWKTNCSAAVNTCTRGHADHRRTNSSDIAHSPVPKCSRCFSVIQIA